MYQNWTKQQIAEATGRWVNTEYEGPPPDNSFVSVWTVDTRDPNPDAADAMHGIGMYIEEREVWVIQFFAEPELVTYGDLGYKSVWYWQCLTLPESPTAPATAGTPTLEKVTDPVILARQTALGIVRDLCEWEAEQGGYEAQAWTDLRIIRDNTAAHTLVKIYDALDATLDWCNMMGGWEAEVWERLADFVEQFADHVERLRVIMRRTGACG